MPIAPSKKSVKSAPAAPVTPMPKKHTGAAWHSVAWIAVLALVFSGATMTLSAMAQSTTPSTCNQNSIAGVRCSLRQISEKIDAINRKIDGLGTRLTTCLPTPEQPQACAPTPTPTETRNTATPPPQAPANQFNAGAINCLQSCEDEFNACSKAAKETNAYQVCKTNYIQCANKCGNPLGDVPMNLQQQNTPQ